MASTKSKPKFLYDTDLVSQRIEDLRKCDGKNKITLEQLSQGILKKTGVYISPTQLGKYENADLKERMNANNLLALAMYYNVSLDYLLGRADTKSNDATDRHTSDKFGLIDSSMKRLEKLKKEAGLSYGDDTIKKGSKMMALELINLILSNDSLWCRFEKYVFDYISITLEKKANTLADYNIKITDIIEISLKKLFDEEVVSEIIKQLPPGKIKSLIVFDDDSDALDQEKK